MGVSDSLARVLQRRRQEQVAPLYTEQLQQRRQSVDARARCDLGLSLREPAPGPVHDDPEVLQALHQAAPHPVGAALQLVANVLPVQTTTTEPARFPVLQPFEGNRVAQLKRGRNRAAPIMLAMRRSHAYHDVESIHEVAHVAPASLPAALDDARHHEVTKEPAPPQPFGV